MNEDISAQIRLSISIICTAALIVMITNLMIIGMGYLGNYQSRIIAGTQVAGASVTMGISSMESVSSATAYKYCRANTNQIDTVEINYRDGSRSFTYKELLYHPSMRVSVIVEETSSGGYYVKIKEVN